MWLVLNLPQEGMVEFIGMLKVKVIRGTNLAIRDMLSSDPYVVLALGQQVSCSLFLLKILSVKNIRAVIVILATLSNFWSYIDFHFLFIVIAHNIFQLIKHNVSVLDGFGDDLLI